jgi:hypothetical protein
MRQVRKAALAPARPSPQDYSVASEASRKLNEARQEKNSQDSGDQQFQINQSNQEPSQAPGSSRENGSSEPFPGIDGIGSTNSGEQSGSERQTSERFEDFGKRIPGQDIFGVTNTNTNDQRQAALDTIATEGSQNQSSENIFNDSDFLTSRQVEAFVNSRSGQIVDAKA